MPGESKGDLEFAMGRIGWAVLGGYSLGCVRGLLPELRNADTRQLVRLHTFSHYRTFPFRINMSFV